MCVYSTACVIAVRLCEIGGGASAHARLRREISAAYRKTAPLLRGEDWDTVQASGSHV